MRCGIPRSPCSMRRPRLSCFSCFQNSRPKPTPCVRDCFVSRRYQWGRATPTPCACGSLNGTGTGACLSSSITTPYMRRPRLHGQQRLRQRQRPVYAETPVHEQKELRTILTTPCICGDSGSHVPSGQAPFYFAYSMISSGGRFPSREK